MTGAQSPWRWVVVLWALVRMPLAAIVIWWIGGRAFIESDLETGARLLQAGFDIASTPMVRAAWGITMLLACLAVIVATRHRGEWSMWWASVVAAAVVTGLAVWISGQSPWRGVPAAVFLAINLWPWAWARFQLPARLRGWLYGLGIGVVEFMFSRHYVTWLGDFWGRRVTPVASRVPAAFGAALVFALSLTGAGLIASERSLRSPDSLTVLLEGDFNWIELDATGRYLFATGHTQSRLLRLDLEHPEAGVARSDSETSGAQDFAYDRRAGEIVLVNTTDRSLMFFDAANLQLTRRLPIPQLSAGDPWLAIDSATGRIAVVSENDSRSGTPFVVVDRASGAQLDASDDDAGNLVKHPRRPVIYLSFFRRRQEVLAYDLERLSITARRSVPRQLSRMTFWDQGNQVLVSSPADGRVLRFDGDTLEPRGQIDAMAGVRSLAVDEQRGVLICGSIATGMIRLIDLRTLADRGRAYIGPWLRTIALDPDRGVAYISSKGAIYSVDYAAMLKTQ